MSESITISRKTPEQKSFQFELLREEGIEYIQKRAGKIWSDYNLHDPGVTILEVLCFAITELGYRANYPVQDLLSLDPSNPVEEDIKNFFTAREILPNCPVTINDYRKLLIDVDIHDPLDIDCEHVGIKNAWLEKSKANEIPVYAHKEESKLEYEPDPLYVLGEGETAQPPLDIGILYDILIEFEKCDAYGDLNENSIESDLVIEEHLPDTNLNGLEIKIVAEFPRWDNEDTDWEDVISIKSNVLGITLKFYNVPNSYEFSYELINNVVKLSGSITTASDKVDIPGLIGIETRINDFIYYESESVLAFYLRKVGKINEIIKEVKAKLHANRNLCEDFYKLNALKVEKIAVCADIELSQEADVEEVQAIMYHEIGKFLSPTVYFYSLDEMLDKCNILNEFSILEIDRENRYFKIDGNLEDILNEKDTITITGSRSNDREYTVESISVDKDTGHTKIYVNGDITSDLLTEDEVLSFYITDEDDCLTSDQIFEGPALDHGFIDDRELEKADRRKVIHVSDLIQIIMDIPGVEAVRSIQIANIPQDNEDGAIESKSVKWCLQLAFDQNYVPRLSILDSKVTFYKDQLPYKASESEVEALMETLETEERPAKLTDPVLDFEVPEGIYRDLDSYESVQNEFPLTYGIGEEGYPTVGSDSDANTLREAQARQLKGYLMIFDQLLANYFAQLSHVKDLFSMNAEKDVFGNYIIGRTYYTQPLFDIVPDVDSLYLDKNGHEVTLNDIAEDEKLFNKRKNKFLDHLIGRFAEKFTDYALLTIKLSGKKKAPEELIEDKLAFLNAYPKISSERGKGFNHQDACKIWHKDNISGLTQRASFLAGIDELGADYLNFADNFSIVSIGDKFQVNVSDNMPTLLLIGKDLYDTSDEAKLSLETMIINGSCKEHYRILTDNGVDFYFTLDCGDTEVHGISEKTDYTSSSLGGDADLAIDDLIEIFKTEFFGNSESNRNNLDCPILNYMDYSITIDMAPDPPEAIVTFNLYSKPLDYSLSNKLLTGQYTVYGQAKSEVDIISVNTGMKRITADGNIASKLNTGDLVIIGNSQDNDGTYTIVNAADAGANTHIRVSENIPSNNVPLGELLYNNDSETGMLELAEEKIPDILWELIYNASQSGKYFFSSDSGNYRFRISGGTEDYLAESVDSDFNDVLANEINNLVSGKIRINGSTGNDGEHTVISATASGPNVEITVDTPFASPKSDGKLIIKETYDIATTHIINTLKVASDLTNLLFEGDTIRVSDTESINGKYTVYSIEFDGANSVIVVEEPIPDLEFNGKLNLRKTFKITEIDNDKVIIKGGYDDQAVNSFIEFIKAKFFSHEGFHVIEHVLLRPKVKGFHFIDADTETITEGLIDNGSLYFDKTLDIFSASQETRFFRVEGDISAELDNDGSSDISSIFSVTGTGANDGFYEAKTVTYFGGPDRTRIKTIEEFPLDIPFSDPIGQITYLKGTPISSVSAANRSFTVSDPGILGLAPGETVVVRGSTDDTNNGRYLVESINDLGLQQEVIISRFETEIEDSLLDIVLDEDECDACQIKDPYTCVASVVLPQWQGRFNNMDFRRFFERQIRYESPAHVFLSICWIDCRQMNELELKYKAWLLENAKEYKDYGKLSATLNELIAVLKDLRNVYPSGTLHDCEEDDTLENAVILGNSVLGNA